MLLAHYRRLKFKRISRNWILALNHQHKSPTNHELTKNLHQILVWDKPKSFQYNKTRIFWGHPFGGFPFEKFSSHKTLWRTKFSGNTDFFPGSIYHEYMNQRLTVRTWQEPFPKERDHLSTRNLQVHLKPSCFFGGKVFLLLKTHQHIQKNGLLKQVLFEGPGFASWMAGQRSTQIHSPCNGTTVDERNPAPPAMYKTMKIMAYLSYHLNKGPNQS